MQRTMKTRALSRAASSAALAAILAAGTGACEHTATLQPLAPRTVPAASAQSREMEALLTALQREMRAQGPADATREGLIAALFAAARGPGAERPATPVPAHVERAMSGLLTAHGDSAAIVRVLQEFADRDTRTP